MQQSQFYWKSSKNVGKIGKNVVKNNENLCKYIFRNLIKKSGINVAKKWQIFKNLIKISQKIFNFGENFMQECWKIWWKFVKNLVKKYSFLYTTTKIFENFSIWILKNVLKDFQKVYKNCKKLKFFIKLYKHME